MLTGPGHYCAAVGSVTGALSSVPEGTNETSTGDPAGSLCPLVQLME